MKNSAKITPKIPDGMVELLKNLAKGVLKEQPDNIYLFAAEYFDNLVRERDGSLNKGYATFRKYNDETVDQRNVCPRCNCILHPERKDEDSTEDGPSPRNDDENALDMSVNGVAIKAVARDGKSSKGQKNRQRLETIRSVSTDSAIEDDGKSKSTSPKSIENALQYMAVPAVGALAAVGGLMIDNKAQEPTESMEIDAVLESPVNEVSVDPISNAKISSDEDVPDTPTNDTSMSDAYTDRTVIEVGPMKSDAMIDEVNTDSNSADQSQPDTNEIVNETNENSDSKSEVIPTVVTKSVDEVKTTVANDDESKSNDVTSLQLANSKQLDRLRTPESDSGLSEKSFNLNIQENEEAITNEVNEIESEDIFIKQDHLNSNEKDGDTTSKDDSGIVDVEENKHLELDNRSEAPIAVEIKDKSQSEHETRAEEISDDLLKNKNPSENEPLNEDNSLDKDENPKEVKDITNQKEIASEALNLANELPQVERDHEDNNNAHDERVQSETATEQDSTMVSTIEHESPSDTVQSKVEIIISKPSSPEIDSNNELDLNQSNENQAPIDEQVNIEVINDIQNDANSKVELSTDEVLNLPESHNKNDDEIDKNDASDEKQADKIISNEDNSSAENNLSNDLRDEKNDKTILDRKQPVEEMVLSSNENDENYTKNSNDATNQSPGNKTQSDQPDDADGNLISCTAEDEKFDVQIKELEQSEAAADSINETDANQINTNENLNKKSELLNHESGDLLSNENPSNDENNNNNQPDNDSTKHTEKADEENLAEQKMNIENEMQSESIGLNGSDAVMRRENENNNDINEQDEKKESENLDGTIVKEEDIQDEKDSVDQNLSDGAIIPVLDTPLIGSGELKTDDDKATNETSAVAEDDTSQKNVSVDDATTKQEAPQNEQIPVNEPEIVKTESKSIESEAEANPEKPSLETFENNENIESNEPDNENAAVEHASWEGAVEKIAKSVNELDANQNKVTIPDIIDDKNNETDDNMSMKFETKPTDENLSENSIVSLSETPNELENPNNVENNKEIAEQTEEKHQIIDETNDKNEIEQIETKIKSATSHDDQSIDIENTSNERPDEKSGIDEHSNQEKTKNDSNGTSSIEKAENVLEEPASSESIQNGNTSNEIGSDNMNANRSEEHVEVDQTDMKLDLTLPDEASDEAFITPPETNDNRYDNEQTSEMNSTPKSDDTPSVEPSDEPKNIPAAESMSLKDEPSNGRNDESVIENGELISPQQEGNDSIDEVKENQTTASHSVGVNESVEKSTMPTEGVDELDSQSEENRTVESVNNNDSTNGNNDTNANEKTPIVNDESVEANTSNGNIEHEHSNDYETKSNNDDGASELSVSTKDDLYEQAETEIVEDESVKDLDLSSNNNIEPTQTNESVDSEQQITALEVPAQNDNDSIDSPKQNPMQPDSLDALVDSLDVSEADSLIIDSLEDKPTTKTDSPKSHEASNEMPNEASNEASNDALNMASNPIDVEDKSSDNVENVEMQPESNGLDRK